MKRVILLAALASALAACAKSEPTLSGGKPVSHWVDALKSPSVQMRKEAALKLGNTGPSDPTILPALLAALADPDAQVRCEVVVALAKFGADAKEAIPVLAVLRQNDRDARVRRYAARALEKLAE